MIPPPPPYCQISYSQTANRRPALPSIGGIQGKQLKLSGLIPPPPQSSHSTYVTIMYRRFTMFTNVGALESKLFVFLFVIVFQPKKVLASEGNFGNILGTWEIRPRHLIGLEANKGFSNFFRITSKFVSGSGRSILIT